MADTLTRTHDSHSKQQNMPSTMCLDWQSHIKMQATTITQLQNQLADRDLSLARLQQDMQNLNTKYVAAIDRAADLQHEKDLVEHDLEELSRRLFEEANAMVALEKRENWRLETRLQTAQQQLGHEQAQLAELRQRLLEWDQVERQYTKKAIDVSGGDDTLYDTETWNQGTLADAATGDKCRGLQSSPTLAGKAETMQQHPRRPFVPQSPTSTVTKRYANMSRDLNHIQWTMFEQFVIHAPTAPLKKLGDLPYLQTCQIEDIEPCLRFGPRSRLSTKKMIEHLLQQSCFIQHLDIDISSTQDTALAPLNAASTPAAAPSSLWERFYGKRPSSIDSPTNCAACGQSNDNCHDFYQFKMHENDDWKPIDQHCRSRLVAVCEFFVFIRNIHLQLYSHRTVNDLYWENIRLRLQMFHSRAGLSQESALCPSLDHDNGSVASSYPPTPK